MDAIYEEMSHRNTKEFLNKGVQLRDWSDGSHCLAIIAKGAWHMNWKAWGDLSCFEELLGSEGIVAPMLHHTILVARPWLAQEQGCYTWEHMGWGQEILDLMNDIESSGMESYAIDFHKLIFTRYGLLMIGKPNKDVNRWRDAIRCKQKARGISSGEVYYNNIFHATLFRWIRDLTPREIFEVARAVDTLNKTYTSFAKIDVYGYQIVNATWLLKEESVEVLVSKDFA